MSTGGKVCAETAADREKLSRPAKNGSTTPQHPAELSRNFQFEQASFPLCQAVWSRDVARWFGRGLSVADPFVCRCLTSPAMLPFPHPAHRTGRADFPHPALGEKFTMSPTGNCSSAW